MLTSLFGGADFGVVVFVVLGVTVFGRSDDFRRTSCQMPSLSGALEDRTGCK